MDLPSDLIDLLAEFDDAGVEYLFVASPKTPTSGSAMRHRASSGSALR